MPCGFDLRRTLKESGVLPGFDHWSEIAAVREGRVFAVDGNAYFSRAGPRIVDSLEILAALPRSVKHWSLTTLREKLIQIGAKVVRHSKYVTFQMAEVAVPRELFAAILERIQRFGVPPPLVQRE